MVQFNVLMCHLVLWVLFVATHAQSVTWNQTVSLLTDIRAAYTQNGVNMTTIVPNENDGTPLNLSMTMFIYSINGFDAVSGQMEIVVSLSLVWYDYILYSSVLKTSMDSITIPFYEIWTPNLVLLNDVQSVKSLGSTTYNLLYDTVTGLVEWNPRIILKGSCSPNMTFFPFDRQECSFVFSAWEHDTSQVELITQDSSWYTSMYQENGVWKISETKSETYIGSSNEFDSYYAKFTIVIERHPLFFIFNLVLPILLLSLLNGFAFLVPVSSGRVSYCITCFLTFVFLLQTVEQFLPRTSYPMSILAIYVVLMMLFSAVVNIITVLTMRLHLAPSKDKTPRWLQVFLKAIKCQICREFREKQKQRERDKIQTNRKATFDGRNNTEISNDHFYQPKKEFVKEVDWPEVARSLDIFFFVLFLGVQAAFSVFFLVPLGKRA